MKLAGSILGALLVLFALVPSANARVVTFDDLGGACANSALADPYGGIVWHGNWICFDAAQDPYNPHSAPARVYSFLSEARFDFLVPDIFDGAWFAGNGASVQFALYANPGDTVAVALSSALITTGTPVYLSSGYDGVVAQIGVITDRPDFYVMDDVTYGVPEPVSLLLLGSGLIALPIAARRRRKSI